MKDYDVNGEVVRTITMKMDKIGEFNLRHNNELTLAHIKHGA